MSATEIAATEYASFVREHQQVEYRKVGFTDEMSDAFAEQDAGDAYDYFLDNGSPL